MSSLSVHLSGIERTCTSSSQLSLPFFMFQNEQLNNALWPNSQRIHLHCKRFACFFKLRRTSAVHRLSSDWLVLGRRTIFKKLPTVIAIGFSGHSLTIDGIRFCLTVISFIFHLGLRRKIWALFSWRPWGTFCYVFSEQFKNNALLWIFANDKSNWFRSL